MGWGEPQGPPTATVTTAEHLAVCDRLAHCIATLEKIADTFSYMPALNGAYSGVTLTELRAEVNESIDYFAADLNTALGQQRLVEPQPKERTL